MRLDSALPARLETDGRLRVQVRPGNWQMTLVSRATSASDEFTLPAPSDNWPAQEIWSYQPDNRLRVTAAEAPSPVDPSQVGVPGNWHNYAAFKLDANESLTIIERQRGLSDQDANRLNLNRHLWLDFDGEDFTAQDRISGQMRRGWRLDMMPPYRLASARENADNGNLLVTEGAVAGWTGVELRRPDVNLETISRIERSGSSLAASGWNEQFDQILTTLSLPPGHRLLAAPGTDQSGAWLEQWRLLDFFLVLLIAVAAGRMISPLFGVLVLAMMTLTYHEVFAPVWSWLNLLIAIALARVAPEGRFRRLTHRYRTLSFVLILLISVPFVANQIRLAMYPQLERSGLTEFRYADVYGSRAPGRMAAKIAGLRIEQDEADARLRRRADQPVDEAGDAAFALKPESVAEKPSSFGLEIPSRGALLAQRPALDRYAANTLLQTGPGKPQWSWNTYRLFWSGPVLESENFKLLIMPSWLVSIWRLLGVLLLGAVVAGLARRDYRLPGGLDKLSPGAGTAAMIIGVLLCSPGLTGTAQADIPDQDLLRELKLRLTENPACENRCAEYSSATVTVSANRVDMELDVQAMVDVAVPLPGSGDRWEPAVVRVDGQPRRNILRTPDGVMWIEIGRGVHRIRLSGPLNANDSQELFFSERPHRVRLSATGWDASGVVDGQLLAGSIGLTRIRKDGEAQTLTSDRFPTFVRVTRQISLNLDWTMTTTVRRRAPANGSITVEIPLLADETVDSERVEIRDGKVMAALAANGQSFSWNSRLTRADSLRLVATDGAGWTETWLLGTSPTWHIEHRGVPEVQAARIASYWIAEFDPLPGEALDISVTRPAAVAGNTLAIDDVQLSTTIGKRSASSALSFSYRSTQGTQHSIRLPTEADVTQVTVDGRPLPLRPNEGSLPLSIEPGAHQVEINWRESTIAGRYNETTRVDLNSQASNIRLRLLVPESRWILYARGPALGPVVLYWVELVAMIAFALMLGRLKRTPLRTRDWVLLGLGLSTFSWGMLMLMAAWLLVMDYQQDIRAKLPRRQFNLLQLALGVFSVFVLLRLLISVPDGLLGTPDMQIIDADYQSNSLNWFADQTDGQLPVGGVISAPIWAYNIAILLWALWLSFALIRWLPWAWRCYTKDGLWKGKLETGMT
jgi:hypothetical protein